MTTTVAQMIAWLQTLPQDAEVKCKEDKFVHHETYIYWQPVDIENCQCHKHDQGDLAGRTIVYIGA